MEHRLHGGAEGYYPSDSLERFFPATAGEEIGRAMSLLSSIIEEIREGFRLNKVGFPTTWEAAEAHNAALATIAEVEKTLAAAALALAAAIGERPDVLTELGLATTLAGARDSAKRAEASAKAEVTAKGIALATIKSLLGDKSPKGTWINFEKEYSEFYQSRNKAEGLTPEQILDLAQEVASSNCSDEAWIFIGDQRIGKITI